MAKTIIFGSGTPRSGGTLIANLISSNREIGITTDLIHFFRHIYNQYPNLNLESKKKIAIEFYLRMKFRKKIILNLDFLIKKFSKVKNYKEVLEIISNIISKKLNKKIVGEYANGEWNNINNFLKLNKNYKAFQVIRDPRAMLMSWKKITYEKNYRYLNIIFNWIDAINCFEENRKKYSNKRFRGYFFEKIHASPKKNAVNLCRFLKIKFDPNMLNTNKWPRLLKNKLNYINVSAYNNKKTFGFANNRSENWKKYILDWELALVQFLLKKYLKKLDYKILNYNKKLIKKGISILKKDKIMSKNLKTFLKTGEGNVNRLKDPKDPKNWAATDLSKNPNLKFVDTIDYKKFLFEKKKLIIKYKIHTSF